MAERTAEDALVDGTLDEVRAVDQIVAGLSESEAKAFYDGYNRALAYAFKKLVGKTMEEWVRENVTGPKEDVDLLANLVAQ
ncbi:hypothetical protein J4U01_gp044 [Mycobacterium phage Kumao]|uniref:Uncharacterized protein n=1 Tax=Mycobacterium phage Kumao TaxID=2041344 RepID=A0A2D1GPR0_9CAUD|nr:hypothetical protein J4U01_gp044 [Mycobacterium phage Kumao]ATN94007.1 hypothetical protein SEA_KUMAO_44 [Mycobacterium phage Kumao]